VSKLHLGRSANQLEKYQHSLIASYVDMVPAVIYLCNIQRVVNDLLQPRNNQFQYFLGSFACVLHIFCNDLPCLRVMRFRRYASIDHKLLMLLLACPESDTIAGHVLFECEILTFVPCCLSNFSHHAHVSPRSLSVAIARWNHCRAFSILPSAQNRRATVQIIIGSSEDFFSASTERALRVARGSSQIASDQRSPEVGHS
jgi:hypothetical protein